MKKNDGAVSSGDSEFLHYRLPQQRVSRQRPRATTGRLRLFTDGLSAADRVQRRFHNVALFLVRTNQARETSARAGLHQLPDAGQHVRTICRHVSQEHSPKNNVIRYASLM